jgi:hypothetical protein
MHPLFILAILVFALVILDLAAYRWGADSRPGPDDHPEWR